MTLRTSLNTEQKRVIHALMVQAWTIRTLQAFIVGLGAYMAAFDGRGWPAFLIGVALAAWFQTQLPALPEWAEKLRKDSP